jgi:membrane-associated phospholipid phosphatase
MAAPPPALNSPEYAAAFDEVRRLGSASSVERTAYQTDTAFLWRAAANTVTPPGQWFEVAQQLANTQNLSTEETSRMFALLGMAVADAGITAWETKNTYNFWRPITGINLADTDGNDLTTADPSWTPLFVTPNHQSYTSGHSTFSAAAATVLANFFGTDSMTFTVTGDNRSREYHSFSAAMQDAGMSRVYGGIHWQFDNQAGLLSGSQVGAWVYQNAFQVPAPSVAGVLGLGGLLAARRRR